MQEHKGFTRQDLWLRLAGLMLLLAGALAMELLYNAVHVPPEHDANSAEIMLAALGFIGLCLGAALHSHGARIFERVEISVRWARFIAAQRRE